ncbi:2-oxo-4-hydroxy-4-carboxy-5-ureidoimidazoline decarboxylase [Paenibacillus sp. P96]|uniref:2-oxo-4-hydroxy-4-carboxy-5-ureidoimidazoline decarboxylase n=1 Tax=Paenibacillus zeirhizosphaerae TaxID=2987519 RepID=A0ABT9FVG6_9BACL|nr:2-oxo-4-hydroxy-4-carboxy-5-ureidoimidazoline decarboxylase [Paenibacillus sp. P96]MDP4098717.1 2-oxo-4-hydroxy-4-carboxy-5-ureidoimidazoline decarboxylase [Paenibacillus sp. P96]
MNDMAVTEYINSLNLTQFTDAFGALFEHSPWIAEQAWEQRPFTSPSHMFEVMKIIVEQAEPEAVLRLLRNHPDLGTRMTMSSDSVKEQAGAGLDSLDPGQYEELIELNRRYTEKFAFPFILAVKGHTPATIIEAAKRRIHHSEADERRTAVEQVCRIAGFRLEDWLNKQQGVNLS